MLLIQVLKHNSRKRAIKTLHSTSQIPFRQSQLATSMLRLKRILRIRVRRELKVVLVNSVVSWVDVISIRRRVRHLIQPNITLKRSKILQWIVRRISGVTSKKKEQLGYLRIRERHLNEVFEVNSALSFFMQFI